MPPIVFSSFEYLLVGWCAASILVCSVVGLYSGTYRLTKWYSWPLLALFAPLPLVIARPVVSGLTLDPYCAAYTIGMTMIFATFHANTLLPRLVPDFHSGGWTASIFLAAVIGLGAAAGAYYSWGNTTDFSYWFPAWETPDL
jgi:hypothetical protein